MSMQKWGPIKKRRTATFLGRNLWWVVRSFFTFSWAVLTSQEDMERTEEGKGQNFQRELTVNSGDLVINFTKNNVCSIFFHFKEVISLFTTNILWVNTGFIKVSGIPILTLQFLTTIRRIYSLSCSYFVINNNNEVQIWVRFIQGVLYILPLISSTTMQGRVYSLFTDKERLKGVEWQILKESVFEPTQS